MVKLYQDIGGETMELIGGRLSSSYIQDFLSNSYDKSAPDTVGILLKTRSYQGNELKFITIRKQCKPW
jgi:hypothetical protein